MRASKFLYLKLILQVKTRKRIDIVRKKFK